MAVVVGRTWPLDGPNSCKNIGVNSVGREAVHQQLDLKLIAIVLCSVVVRMSDEIILDLALWSRRGTRLKNPTGTARVS